MIPRWVMWLAANWSAVEWISMGLVGSTVALFLLAHLCPSEVTFALYALFHFVLLLVGTATGVAVLAGWLDE